MVGPCAGFGVGLCFAKAQQGLRQGNGRIGLGEQKTLPDVIFIGVCSCRVGLDGVLPEGVEGVEVGLGAQISSRKGDEYDYK